MLELLIAFGIGAVLLAATLLYLAASWQGMLVVGFVIIAGGFVLGVPTGFWYHVKLYQALAPRGDLPPRWWLAPIRLHEKLRPEERFKVLFWCGLGAAGFVLILLGAALTAAGALKGR